LKRKTLRFFLINTGLALVAAGIVLFKAPNGFATGGVSGLAIVLSRFLPGSNVGLSMLVINIGLLCLSVFTLGREFFLSTAYASVALSAMVSLGERLIPVASPLTGDTMLELCFAILLPGAGSAIVFHQGASTGGTDIVAKLLSKKTSLNIGNTLLIADFAIALAAVFALGLRPGLYSVLGLLLKSVLVDIVLDSLNTKKKMEIVSEKADEIETFILQNIHRGVTVHRATGGFSGREKTVLTAVLSRSQALRLQGFVRKTDPDAFVIITNTSGIIGRGFKST